MKFIDADPALERRFQVVDVEEPDMATAITIAHGVRDLAVSAAGTTAASNAARHSALVQALKLS